MQEDSKINDQAIESLLFEKKQLRWFFQKEFTKDGDMSSLLKALYTLFPNADAIQINLSEEKNSQVKAIEIFVVSKRTRDDVVKYLRFLVKKRNKIREFQKDKDGSIVISPGKLWFSLYLNYNNDFAKLNSLIIGANSQLYKEIQDESQNFSNHTIPLVITWNCDSEDKLCQNSQNDENYYEISGQELTEENQSSVIDLDKDGTQYDNNYGLIEESVKQLVENIVLYSLSNPLKTAFISIPITFRGSLYSGGETKLVSLEVIYFDRCIDANYTNIMKAILLTPHIAQKVFLKIDLDTALKLAKFVGTKLNQYNLHPIQEWQLQSSFSFIKEVIKGLEIQSSCLLDESAYSQIYSKQLHHGLKFLTGYELSEHLKGSKTGDFNIGTFYCILVFYLIFHNKNITVTSDYPEDETRYKLNNVQINYQYFLEFLIKFDQGENEPEHGDKITKICLNNSTIHIYCNQEGTIEGIIKNLFFHYVNSTDYGQHQVSRYFYETFILNNLENENLVISYSSSIATGKLWKATSMISHYVEINLNDQEKYIKIKYN